MTAARPSIERIILKAFDTTTYCDLRNQNLVLCDQRVSAGLTVRLVSLLRSAASRQEECL